MTTQRFIKFLVDESVEFRIVLFLRNLGFGGLIFKEKQKSSGIIFIRLPRVSVDEKLVRLTKILQPKHKDLSNVFTTISQGQTRSRLLLKE